MRKFWLKVFTKILAPKVKVCYQAFDNTHYEIDNNTIILSGDLYEAEDLGFLRHARECHENGHLLKGYSAPLIAVLHEIGHSYTIWDYEDDLEAREKCAQTPWEVAKNSIEIQDLYYNIDCEFAATDWAIDFIKRHPKLCKWFDKKIR